VRPPLCATAYWLLLRDVTTQPPYLPSVKTWTRSFLARYVPSGALTVAVRIRERGTASASQVLSAPGLENFPGRLGVASAATAAFALAHASPPLAAPVVLAGAVAVAFGLRLGAVRRRVPRLVPVRAAALAGATALSGASWLAAGTAVWIMAAAIAPGSPDPLLLVGAYAFAWLVGFLAVLAPGGLGVREATLVVLIAPQLGLGTATLVAVALRLANLAGDLGAALIELGSALVPALPRHSLRDV
jgi:glycosyltransferase 2 family protein